MIKEIKTEEEFPLFYEEILSLLPRGSANPITVAELKRKTGLSSVVIRSAVSNLILKHNYKIATSTSGYYFITNDEERDATVRNLKSRAFKILARAKAIEEIPNENQESLSI